MHLEDGMHLPEEADLLLEVPDIRLLPERRRRRNMNFGLTRPGDVGLLFVSSKM